MAEGIERRELKDGRVVYVGRVWDPRARRRVNRTFPTIAAARKWRAELLGRSQRGVRLVAPDLTLTAAGEALLAGMRSGRIRPSSGEPYRPSVIRGYTQALRDYIEPDLGGLKLGRVERRHVQTLVDELLGRGLDPSTIRNAIKPLQAIYRRAVEDGELGVNPTLGLRLPASRGRRDRVASPEEARALLAALEGRDRAIFAAAFYAGLRLGELRALRWSDVRLDKIELRIERALDATGVVISPKSRAGRRTVPIIADLRKELVLLRLAAPRHDDALVFGTSPSHPFAATVVSRRAKAAWGRAGLTPIGLHEARHTFASFLIAAGANVKAIQDAMGHASATVTLDRYGHLMPGGREELRERLERFLRGSSE